MPIARIPISESPSVIGESCVVKLNSDYQVEPNEHHLNYAFVLNRKVKLSPQDCLNINTSLTCIDIEASPNLEVVHKDVSHSRRDVESKLKRNVKR